MNTVPAERNIVYHKQHNWRMEIESHRTLFSSSCTLYKLEAAVSASRLHLMMVRH